MYMATGNVQSISSMLQLEAYMKSLKIRPPEIDFGEVLARISWLFVLIMAFIQNTPILMYQHMHI